uniref:SAM domain-containing protein n=1 Tax=Dicentrarchus labrax TaxID=13489 RepID=A0A8C4NV75_DICLA
MAQLIQANMMLTTNNETYQERLLRLEGDKESLVLQVSVLTDQVEAQGEKIRDLESSLEEHRQKLASTEEMLQQELMSRTSLETQKLDLMDEVSYLKLKLVSMEETQTNTHPQDPADTEQNKAECVVNLISELQEQMCRFQEEISTRIQEKRALEEREAQQGESEGSQAQGHSPQDLLQEVKHLKSRVDELEGEKGQYERKLRGTKAEISELQQLLASKDAEIECLQTQLLARGGTANDNAERDQEYQRLKVGMESLLASNDEKDRRIEELTILLGQYRKMREVMASVFILSSQIMVMYLKLVFFSILQNPHLELSKYQTLPGKRCKKSELRAELNGDREGDGEYFSPVHSHDQAKEYSLSQLVVSMIVFLGFCLAGHPEKLEECVLSDQSPLSSGVDSGQQSPVSPENRKSQRGIKKLWGKIRRSQSGSPAQVHDPELAEFKRGGFRATAGPRLARSGNTRDLKMPLSKWSAEQVCDWLEEIGLGQYGILARHWVTGGQTLLSATPQDLERELAMKNPLHRKKLQLAIKTLSSKQPEKSAELDYVWVTRWLDDIGLPQYKDQFNDGRVDGQMLQYLTVNDLLFLKVTSQLHHLSVKCAIHVLHVNKFHPNCLKRRPGNEVSNQCTPSEVVQWSNHRVMEWLRSVDLAEYAPNLRGSGVHGGLVMLEPRFNSDTLAMLLNIPPQKTLLRRHLTTNFNSLVGAQAQHEKREYTEAAGYTPLSITAKVKPKKLGFSNLTHLRRRRPDESTDYVCPIESSSPQSGQSAVNGVQVRPYAGFRGLSPILDRESDRSRDQVGLDAAGFEGCTDTMNLHTLSILISLPVRCLTNPTSASNLCHDLTHHERTQTASLWTPLPVTHIWTAPVVQY